MSHLHEIESSLEWEALAKGLDSLHVVRFGPHHGELGTLSIARADDYGLSFLFTTNLGRDDIEKLDDVPRGTLVDGIIVEAVGRNPVEKVVVPNVVITNTSFKWDVRTGTARTTLTIASSEVVINTGNRQPSRFLTEWFISGPRQFRWTQLTSRERHHRLVRTRGARRSASEEISVERPPGGAMPDSSLGWDHMLLPLPDDLRLVVAQVPENFGPAWSKCLSFEYHYLNAKPPVESVRDGAVEALGFIFGRQLLRVGRTTYDQIGQPLEEQACKPWGRDSVATSQHPDMPPCTLRHMEKQILIGRFLREYIQRRNDLGLKEVMWTIWIAHRMPLGFELPLYSAALERLMTAWFRSSGSKSKGVYMEKSQFERITMERLNALEPEFDKVRYGNRILGKMRGAFQMGANDRFEVFLEEIGLKYGAGELAVFRARNTSAHGGAGSSGANQRNVDLARGYQTLLNRCILKLVGGFETYTDYSSRGHPERWLEQPIGIDLNTPIVAKSVPSGGEA